jgi:hypothetical protein
VRDPVGAELLLFARALLLFPTEERPMAACRILEQVERADRLMRTADRIHPAFGDGSLMSRCCLLAVRPEPMASDGDFLSAVIVACHALLHHSGS